MIKCIEEGQLKAYIDAALPEVERAEVGMHISACEACQSKTKELEGLSAKVETLLITSVTALDKDSALARLRINQQAPRKTAAAQQEAVRLAGPRHKASRRLAPAWRISTAMAGVGLAVVMIGVLGLLMLAGRDNGTARAQQVPSVLAGSPLGEGVLVQLRDDEHERREVRAIDLSSGEVLPGYPPITINQNPEWSWSSMYALSADNSRLALIESNGESCWPSAGGRACMGSADALHLIDLRAWQDITVTLPVTFSAASDGSDSDSITQLYKGSTGGFTFNRDGSRLALGYDYHIYERNEHRFAHRLVLVDSSEGKIAGHKDIEFQPMRIEFSQDGSRLVVYGQSLGSEHAVSKPGPLQVLLLDAHTLEVQWSQTLDDVVSGTWCIGNCVGPHDQMVFESWTPAVVPSHDRRKLYILHADVDRLTTLDLEARTVHGVEVRKAHSWFERFLDLTASKADAKGRTNGAYKRGLLSVDGSQLYVTGYKIDWRQEPDQERFGLQVINLDTSDIVANYGSNILGVRTSLDGDYLYLSGRQGQNPESQRWNKVLDAKSLKHIATVTEWSIIPTRRLGGEPILLAVQGGSGRSDAHYGVLDPQTYQVPHSWTLGSSAYMVTNP
jgi:hypothetical protein